MTKHCSFCKATVESASQLVGCGRADICDGCIRLAEEELAITPPSAGACTFCRETKSSAYFAAGDCRICAACLELCVEILQATRAPLPVVRIVTER